MSDSPRPVRKVNIGGVDWDDAVASVEVEDHDRLIDQATILLRDRVGASHDVVAQGQRVKIEMGWDDSHAVIFEGIVQRASSSPGGDAREQTVVAYDMSSKMHIHPDKRQTRGPGNLDGIVRAIVGSYGIPVGDIQADPNPHFEQLTPGPVTDWQFLQMLAVRYRARAFVEYNDGASKFYWISEQKLAKQSAKTRLHCCSGFGREVIDFQHERVSTTALPYRVAAVIDPSNGNPSPQVAPPVTPAAPPPSNDERQTAADANGSGASYRAAVDAALASTADPTIAPQLSAAGLPSDPDLAAALARPDPTQIRGFRARATVLGNIELRAKSKVNVQGVSSFIDGDWYVRVARHVVANDTYQTALVLTQ
ncbi:MAG: hypothetical protein U0Q18_27675 [Bryobacteraceae bacterium]